MTRKTFTNGQPTYQEKDGTLTHFFKSGKIKAQGPNIKWVMEGEWKFYRETGQHWQTGNFKKGKKHGQWTRFDKDGNPELEETYEDGELVTK